RGEPREAWDGELPPEEFPTVRSLAQTWRENETEMRGWLESLDDDALEATVDLGPKDRFPLSVFLLHVLTHSVQQRRDAVILLERAGHSPPETDFLYYADSRGGA
ncbi:MAG: DinB family protein, partial [Actinomycetota bacterium]